MKKRFLTTIFVFIYLFLSVSPKAFALNASEVANRQTDCQNYELASAEPNGSLNKVACYDTYQETKETMDKTENDNLVIVFDKKIIDAKYALIDYDHATNAGYTKIYQDKNLKNELTYIRGGDSDDAVFLEMDN